MCACSRTCPLAGLWLIQLDRSASETISTWETVVRPKRLVGIARTNIVQAQNPQLPQTGGNGNIAFEFFFFSVCKLVSGWPYVPNIGADTRIFLCAHYRTHHRQQQHFNNISMHSPFLYSLSLAHFGPRWSCKAILCSGHTHFASSHRRERSHQTIFVGQAPFPWHALSLTFGVFVCSRPRKLDLLIRFVHLFVGNRCPIPLTVHWLADNQLTPSPTSNRYCANQSVPQWSPHFSTHSHHRAGRSNVDGPIRFTSPRSERMQWSCSFRIESRGEDVDWVRMNRRVCFAFDLCSRNHDDNYNNYRLDWQDGAY